MRTDRNATRCVAPYNLKPPDILLPYARYAPNSYYTQLNLLIPFRSLLVVLLAVQDPQDSEEKVDHVKVQTNRRRDLLLDMVVSHDELCVN